jgi:Spy/CpxP family protein refolding chaperone
MYSLRTLALSLLFISVTVVSAHAARHGFGGLFDHHEKGSGQIERLKQALDLSPQQAASLKEVHTESNENTAAMREQVEVNREAMRKVFDAEILDKTRLRELTSEQAELRSSLMIEKHAMREKVDQILTPEQQKQHQQFRQQKMKSKGHRRCNE